MEFTEGTDPFLMNERNEKIHKGYNGEEILGKNKTQLSTQELESSDILSQ